MQQLNIELGEIHGFSSPGEYKRFVEYINRLCQAGDLIQIATDPSYGKGEIYGGLWFKEASTGKIWRLKAPEPPFYGLWEQVKY